jgi:stage II sporulation protein AA (anti-sigma F factor antagonist)
MAIPLEHIQQDGQSATPATAEPHAEHEATAEVHSPSPGVAEVVLGGEHDLSSAHELEGTLGEALTTCSHLIVNLSSVEFVDSSTIKVLVNAKKVATERDCPFNLVLSTTPIVERVLEVTGVLEYLDRVHSTEEALQVGSSEPRALSVVGAAGQNGAGIAGDARSRRQGR